MKIVHRSLAPAALVAVAVLLAACPSGGFF